MVHVPPCRSTEDHITAIVAEREWPSLTDLLDRWDHDREEEMRLAALEDAPALTECLCSGIYGRHAFKADGCNFGPGQFRFHAIYPR